MTDSNSVMAARVVRDRFNRSCPDRRNRVRHAAHGAAKCRRLRQDMSLGLPASVAGALANFIDIFRRSRSCTPSSGPSLPFLNMRAMAIRSKWTQSFRRTRCSLLSRNASP